MFDCGLTTTQVLNPLPNEMATPSAVEPGERAWRADTGASGMSGPQPPSVYRCILVTSSRLTALRPFVPRPILASTQLSVRQTSYSCKMLAPTVKLNDGTSMPSLSFGTGLSRTSTPLLRTIAVER
jgi:hypothetical protein